MKFCYLLIIAIYNKICNNFSFFKIIKKTYSESFLNDGRYCAITTVLRHDEYCPIHTVPAVNAEIRTANNGKIRLESWQFQKRSIPYLRWLQYFNFPLPSEFHKYIFPPWPWNSIIIYPPPVQICHF